MEEVIQNQVSLLIGKYGWLFLVGVLTLLFRSTIEKFVAGWFIFMGNDYNEDDEEEFLEDRNSSIYAGDNFINKSATNWKYIK